MKPGLQHQNVLKRRLFGRLASRRSQIGGTATISRIQRVFFEPRLQPG
jgi:hypothetical protein